MTGHFAGASLVAFYGIKPIVLQDWLASLQGEILRRLPAFVPRRVEQIHATVVGLEFPFRAVTAADVRGLTRSVVSRLENPVDLQFGGYLRGSSSFTSRGLDPYDRSFGFRDGHAIVIGWPVPPTDVLADMRRGAETFGFRHRYHGPGEPLDPDCYMVVGEHRADLPSSAEADIRAYLAANPVHLRLTADDVSLVRYRSTTLDPASSEQIRPMEGLSDAVAQRVAMEARAN